MDWDALRAEAGEWVASVWAWIAAAWADLSAWWAGLPPLGDLDLPPVADWAVTIVIATVLLALAASALVTGWVDRRVSWAGLFTLVVSAGLFFWVWEADRDVGLSVVPEAFVEVVARIIR